MKRRPSSQEYIIGIGGILILCLFIFLFFTGALGNWGQNKTTQVEFSEAAFERDLKKLASAEQTFMGAREFFVSLADEKGGVYAFEILKRATLPPNTDLHLMGHAIGDELYKQEGLIGMQHCTHDFRNACSHSIVVGALLEHGLAVLDEINKVCKEAPGGRGAYTMCFHGFGHGVLAFTEYEIPDAVELCKKVGTKEYGYEEATQCIGGMVMEMHQGVHDPEIWEKKKDKYLTPTDPLRMCNEAYMPEAAKVLCFSYITPFMFDAAGAQGGNPTPDIYTKSFSYCDAVLNDEHRKSCYAGFGKEFIVLAQDRDIRQIEDTPTERLQLAASWCALAERQEGKEACLIEILDSLYWGGENDPEVSIRYCSLLASDSLENACFEHLFTITSYYKPDPTERAAVCALVPNTQQQLCEESLLQ